MDEGHVGWVVESSRDGEQWRRLGTGWTLDDEPLLVHGASTYLRFRRSDQPQPVWSSSLERTGNEPIALLHLQTGTRQEVWPAEEHLGLPVLLPGGEVGRLLRFEHSPDGDEWTWALEFRGSRQMRR
jgi:hypothetical protein